MPQFKLIAGQPEEPDTSDWDALCRGPKIEGFFSKLLQQCGGVSWSAPHIILDSEGDGWHVQEGWYGSDEVHATVKVSTCLETSDIDVACNWHTQGIPAMNVEWDYGLEKAGQLGHCAYRHRRLECDFDSADAQAAFARVWLEHFGVEPVFA